MSVHSKVPVEFAFIMVLRRYFWDWRFRWTMRNGEHFSMPSPFSTVLFKKDGSLVRLVGASHMSLTTQIWMLPCCFWRNICLQRLWWACNFPGIRFSTWWPKCNMEVESLTTWTVSFSLHMLPSGWSKGCLGHHLPSTRTVRITTTRSQKAPSRDKIWYSCIMPRKFCKSGRNMSCCDTIAIYFHSMSIVCSIDWCWLGWLWALRFYFPLRPWHGQLPSTHRMRTSSGFTVDLWTSSKCWYHLSLEGSLRDVDHHYWDTAQRFQC